MPYAALPVSEPAFEVCVAQAEQKYQVPSCILRAVHQVESSGSLEPGLVRSNSNGTKDYSATQINTVWVNYFQRKFGLSASQFASDACLAINGTAYIIRYEINSSGDFWTGVGRYHSRTPGLHDRYVRQVADQAQRFGCQIK